jgi:hypothetical protein
MFGLVSCYTWTFFIERTGPHQYKVSRAIGACQTDPSLRECLYCDSALLSCMHTLQHFCPPETCSEPPAVDFEKDASTSDVLV